MIGSIVLLVVLIFLNAVFASAEIAVISMNDRKLKKLAEQGNKRAVKLSALTEQPARFLATIQVAITLSGFLSSAFAADNFAGPLVQALIKTGVPIPAGVLNSIAVFVITVVLAYFNLVLGELVPKRIAMKKADSLAMGLSGMLYGVSKIFAPLVAVLTLSTNGILRLIGIRPEEDEEKLSEEEIRMILAEGSEQGVIDEQESAFIQNLFEFDDSSAEQICTHRLHVAALDEEASKESWEDFMLAERHTYYPLYKGSKDNITGILDAREYFRLKERDRETAWRQAVKEPYFIPEEMKADTLFQEMKRKRNYFAVLLDEYGGMSGIITLHDLVEELVGELGEEETEEDAERLVPISDRKWKVSGDTELQELEETWKISLPTEEYDTFNGLVYHMLGRIPEDGEKFQCEGYGLKIQGQKVIKHRVEEALVEITEESNQVS